MEEWRDYKMVVTENIKDLKDAVEIIKEILSEQKAELRVLTLKCSIFGTLGGVMVILTTIFIEWLKAKH